MTREEHIGVDEYNTYTYYEIIDFEYCLGCEHFIDNGKQCRFECYAKNCIKESEE